MRAVEPASGYSSAYEAGDAWGLTEARSRASGSASHSALMSVTIDADEAW